MPLPSTAPITLPVATPPVPPSSNTAGGDDTPFARMLSTERSTSQDDADAAPREPGRAGAARAQPGKHAMRDGKPRSVDGRDDTPARDGTISEALTTEAEAQRTGDAHDDTAITDPALAGWIAALHPAAARPAGDGGDAIDTHGKGAKPDTLTLDASSPRSTNAAALSRADKDERDAGQRLAAALAADDAAHGDAAADDTRGQALAQAPRFELPKIGELASAHAPVHAEQRAEPGAAPVVVEVATPVTTPEFKEALGVHVSVLARDGVQQAELHLNPTDMGPISVQIALDGTRAQVDFGAASSATRQAIEAGLPALAAALRDAGFTLAGGGVSQHAGGQPGQREGTGEGGNRRASRIGDGADGAPARRVSMRLPQGAVDLYA
jgi:flagellar hook-length control protein FliK